MSRNDLRRNNALVNLIVRDWETISAVGCTAGLPGW
jgi:hypothetical protein